MPRRTPRTSVREAGYALVALVASMTVALIAMAVAVPTWRHVVQNEREQELIFRGGQIADAIARYQRKNANTLPASIDQLVKGRYLRKAYKDPMTKNGEWRLVRQGEAILPGVAAPGTRPAASPSPSPTPRPSSGLGSGGTLSVGPFLGVASRSTDKGLRLFNGRERYNEWLFVVGGPRVVGRQSVGPQAPGIRQQGLPGQPVQPLQPQPRPR